eukprot:GHVS01004853.1.p1 GENE.GHVS01004853.1~~GHVS01004853.1.p1  ORF type:complete len:631 (+),score=102.33 GHVS01004853.1:116-2008(+)
MGRGEYYRNKYGGGGRGGNQGSYRGGSASQTYDDRIPSVHGDIRSCLLRLDHKPYGAYRDLLGNWECEDYTIIIDKIQSDPFAPPSHFRIRVPQAVAQLPTDMYSCTIRNIALCDYLTRQLHHQIAREGLDEAAASGVGWSGSKGGDIRVVEPSQYVLKRTSVVVVDDGAVEARLTLALPARGRTIEGGRAIELVLGRLPTVVRRSLYARNLDAAEMRAHVLSVEDQQALRDSLDRLGLVSFVNDGAILPRTSGASDLPMTMSQEPHLVPFKSPDDLRVSIELPNRGSVVGLGIRRGITLIVGGGFNGKSTLLEALQFGVYNKIPGDGREFVSTVDAAVKIRAEDGRSVKSVDISPFINNLPFGKKTTSFSSEDASGSTSQAANIMEALELGAQVLLVDEDTCATNFMIRDSRMQALVAKEKEPITAFRYKVLPLFADLTVSTVMVVGGSGDFFEVADCILQMDEYHCCNVTSVARAVVQRYDRLLPAELKIQDESRVASFGSTRRRWAAMESLSVGGGKVGVKCASVINYGSADIDLSGVEQLVELSQLRAIADTLQLLAEGGVGGDMCLSDVLKFVRDKIFADTLKGSNGLDALARFGRPNGGYALPRIFEISAAINRLRSLRIRKIL